LVVVVDNVERFRFLSLTCLFVGLWICSSKVPGRNVVVVDSTPDCERLAIGFHLCSILVRVRSFQMQLAKLLALRVQITRGLLVLQTRNVLVVIGSVTHSVQFLVPLACQFLLSYF
jgi:hypothetical protein